MGLLGGLINTAIDIAIIPLVAANDILYIADGEVPDNLINHVGTLGGDVIDIFDDL